jgi:signal transduction histidine kinase
MGNPRRRGLIFRLRSRGAFLLGAAAGASLIGLAWSPLLQPTDLGKQQLVGTIQSLTDVLIEDWRHKISQREHLLFKPWGNYHRQTSWADMVQLRQGVAAIPWDIPESEQTTAFDALFSEATRREVQDRDLEGAILDCQAALQRTTENRRMGLANLRLLQLASKSEDENLAVTSVANLSEILTGSETLQGLPVLLLAGLAATAVLADSENPDIRKILAEFRAKLIAASTAREIAYPKASFQLTRSPLESEDRPRISGFALDSTTRQLFKAFYSKDRSEKDESSTMAIWQALRTELLLRRWDLPDAQPDLLVALKPNPAALAEGLILEDELLLMHPALDSERIQWSIINTAYLEHTLLKDWNQTKGLWPAGFTFHLVNSEVAANSPTSAALPGTPLFLQIEHQDPAAFEARAQRPFVMLRWGLSLLGVLCGLAGFALDRALLRERRVQKLKTDFVANVSHELRTPLASILLMSENLQQGRVASSENQNRYHSLILREAQRLRRLVDDVLDFSRLDRGRQVGAQLRQIHLQHWAEQLQEELREWAHQYQVELNMTSAWPAASGSIDSDALRRAVFNLADNALRHSGSKQIDLEFGVAPSDSAEPTLTIRVRDHGKGLPAGTETRIFSAFVQLESARVQGQGAGLGLAIVEAIVKEHGGTISAGNHREGGACFTITLPQNSHV